MKRFWRIVPFLILVGCTGIERDCSSWSATNFGSDWIVVQQRITDGEPYNCWLLKNSAITNEDHSDGIFWQDAGSGALVHVAGQYLRVQVAGGKFRDAGKLVGVDVDKCRGGRYPSREESAP